MAAMGAHVEAMLALQRAGAVTFDYGNNIRTQAKKAGVEDAFDIPGLRARVHPAAVLRRPGAVPLGGAFGRSRRHLPHGPSGAGAVPAKTKRWRAGLPWRGSASSSRGCRRASAGWATASAPKFGVAINRLVRRGEIESADRDRARPPGRRLGGVALSARPKPCGTAPTRSPIGRC